MPLDTSLQQNIQLEIERALRLATTQHQTGGLQLAEELYLSILQLNPAHPDANHNMGVLTVQKNQPAASLSYFLAALDADPARGQYWISYIDALFQAGQSEDARQVLALARQQGLEGPEVDALALRLGDPPPVEPTPVSSTVVQGKPKAKPAAHQKKNPSLREIITLSALLNKGRYAEAAPLAQKMTERFPSNGLSWKALGIAFIQMGENAEALVPLQTAAKLLPDDFDAQNNLGNALQNMGRLAEAEISYRKVLQIKPSYAEVHCNLGNNLRNQGRLDEAEACYNSALQFKPNYAEAYNNLGNMLLESGEFNKAESSLRRAIQLKSNFAEAHYNLAITLKALDRLNEAVTSGQRAIALEPTYAQAHCNLSDALKELGRLDEAEASSQRALAIKPDFTDALGNLANVFMAKGNSEAAINCLFRMLVLKPDSQKARMNLGFAQLSCGQLIAGWENYEFRTDLDKKRFPHLPFWTGKNLAGKTILISGEQGIGDEIMFASMFSEIIAQAGRCVIECAVKLVPLFTRSFPAAQVIPKTEPPHPATHSGIDYQCAAGSLAQWLRPNLASFPQQNNSLKADPARVAYWKTRLAELGPGHKIGINWRSSLTTGERNLHYTTLDQWGPIFTTQGVHFINLQYDKCSAELDEARQRFGVPLHSFTEVDMYNDLVETAALIQTLDLVICAPTAVSSIAAALGVDTCVMSYGISWNSLGTKHDPWFPSLRYISRQWNQPWDKIIRDVAGQLKLLAEKHESVTF